MEKKIKTVVLTIIENEKGEILVTKRIDPKIKNAHQKWDIPGGTNEFGESLEETIIREVKEETGLTIKDLEFLPINYSKLWEHQEYLQHTLLYCYSCKLNGGELQTNDPKIGEVKWTKIEEVLDLDLLETTTIFIKKYIDMRK